jgi:site-specific recombinase XerD
MNSGAISLEQIGQRDVLEWMHGQPASKTAWNKLSGASAVFRWARHWRMMMENPLDHIDLPKDPIQAGADSLTSDELRALRDSAMRFADDPRSAGPARVRFYLFLWFTALIFGEARLQPWRAIDWRAGKLRVSRDKAKRGDHIPLASELVREMRHWPRNGARIFEQVPCHHVLTADFRSAGIEGRGNWHRLRKGRMSQLMDGGGQLPLVAKLTHYQNLRTLLLQYTHITLTQIMDRPRFRPAEQQARTDPLDVCACASP